jgi:multiple sugar transport system ATP-binding protein
MVIYIINRQEDIKMATIELKNISKSFNEHRTEKMVTNIMKQRFRLFKSSKSRNLITENKVFNNINLTIPDSKIVVVLGPTGCGKTTLLKIISGLIIPDQGEVLFNGLDKTHTAVKERKIGMVFQNYALYPHFNVRRNILSYFFFRKRTPELNREAREKYVRTSELMGVDIEYLLGRMPPTLSGGEKQKVAIARCITRDPSIFLLDEPFSNLDQGLRNQYKTKLKHLLKYFNITTVYVTHDQKEAVFFADTLVIMNKKGEIVQTGTLDEIYNQPKNKFIAEFLRLHTEIPSMNFMDGRFISDDLKENYIGIRPEEIAVYDKESENSYSGRVVSNDPMITTNNVVMEIEMDEKYVNPEVGENLFCVQIPSEKSFAPDTRVFLEPKKYHVFDRFTDLRSDTVICRRG